MTGRTDDAADPGAVAQPLDLRVVAGRPSDEELAAVTAVLHAAVAERSAVPESLVVPNGRHWQRVNGLLRTPLTPGPREWRSF